MDRMIFTTATGLRAQMTAQAAIANNIANASTTGFKAERVQFQQMMLKGGAGAESRAAATSEVMDADRQAGAVRQTGRPLDVAVPGRAWIAVQAADGSEAYTRRGDLRIAESGVLETGDGHPVLGANGPITVPPAAGVSIAEDGSLAIRAMGAEAGAPPQVIDRIKLADPTGSQTAKGVDNLLRVRGGGALPQDMDATVISGALEGSNVDMTQALVDMIENQRGYELQATMLKEAKQMDETSASLMRVAV